MFDKCSEVNQLNEFLDELPEVPRDKVCVDSSEGYQAYSAMNFGKIGDRSAADVQLKAELNGCFWMFLADVRRPTLEASVGCPWLRQVRQLHVFFSKVFLPGQGCIACPRAKG